MIRRVDWRRRVGSLARRPLVLVGLMLLAVGVPEVIIGHNKAREYRAELATLPPPTRHADPTQLYPELSAADEKRAVVEAKVGYYDLLRSAGRILLLLGVASLVIGIVVEPRHPATPAREPETSSWR